MRRKIAPLLTAAACSALLVSCFGGGGDSPTPTPTPTPSPTPTPTPTPTPAIVFDFAQAFTATVSNTSYGFAYFTPNGGTEVWSDGNGRNGQSQITYAVSPESAAFAWPDAATLTTFGAADRQTATPTLRSYRKGSDALVMELPFQHVLRVSYESVVPFVRETVAGSLRSNRVSLFFNGVTTSSDITTNLSYIGTAQVAGGKPGTTPPGVFSSPATTFTVTASDKKITGSITIVETVNGSPVVRAVLPVSATLGAGGGFAGNIDDAANGFKGSFLGSLAGPAREEVFLLFTVSHTDERKFIGSLIGN